MKNYIIVVSIMMMLGSMVFNKSENRIDSIKELQNKRVEMLNSLLK